MDGSQQTHSTERLQNKESREETDIRLPHDHSAGTAGETNEQQENKAQVTDIPLGTRAIPD
jgi:hypothetical protein